MACSDSSSSFSDGPTAAAPSSAPTLLVVTGLSGAGKSTALQVLEDVGFFTADGLPPALLPEFLNLARKPDMEHFRGLALGMDFRRGATIQTLSEALGHLRAAGTHPALLFLEARPEVILRRYATTRRPHPVEREGLGLEQAVAEERRRLTPVREAADLVLDTSAFTLHDLRREIQHRWNQARVQAHAMRVHLVSFGFKYGVPSDADMVFDLRFLPNPYFIEELRPLSGCDAPVADYVFGDGSARLFRDRFLDFLLFLLPYYDSEGRYRLTLGLGCTGGRHRSVAMTELAAHTLRQAGYAVTVEHRHWKLG
ncbi:MAG: RNase adapter RapZ [Desulfovibrionaceae bacterium]|nr:RNase adapter RapZ [Desulfovibrionaceae bacterium]PWM71579.1 MAG: RNase adapter RapZ [Desulfovibrionaceae bacterium]